MRPPEVAQCILDGREHRATLGLRVMVQVLTPHVQHRDGTDLRAETAGISGDAAQRPRRSLEQDAVDRGLVVERDLSGGR